MYFLEQLHDFSIQKKLDRCPLCGKKFQTNEKLDVSIRKQLNKYVVIGENNPALLVDGLFDAVCMKLNNSDNSPVCHACFEIAQSILSGNGFVEHTSGFSGFLSQSGMRHK